MKPYPIFLSFFLIYLIPLSFSQENSEEPDLSEAFRLIDTWLEAQYQYDQLPGISVAIVKDQEILFSKGYGWADTDNKVPAENPAKAFTRIRHQEGHTFRRVRKDGSLGETWEFQVDESGKVSGYTQHSNWSKKLGN